MASGRRRCRAPRPVSRHGYSKPVAAPAARLPERNKEVPTPTARTASRFRGGACHLAGSRSRSALPSADANDGREMAEDGELESQRFHARPPSKRCQHPGWFILQIASTVPIWCHGHRGRRRNRTARERPCSEEGGRLERHGVTRASLSGRARPPGRFTFHKSGGRGHASRAVRADRTTVIPPPHCVRWEGIEPPRPKTHAPEACAAASYATSARE